MTSTNKQSQARTDTQRHLWHFPSVHHFLDHSRSHSSTQVRSVLYKSEMQMLLIFFLSQRERRPYSDWSPRSTPIWTDPNWTTPNWTTPNWTTPIWTEGSIGLPPFGLPPFGLPPIGLTQIGLPPFELRGHFDYPHLDYPPIGLPPNWTTPQIGLPPKLDHPPIGLTSFRPNRVSPNGG